MSKELTEMLDLADCDKLRGQPRFQKIPPDLLQLKEVAVTSQTFGESL